MGKTYKDMKNRPKWERVEKKKWDDDENEDRSPRPSRGTRDEKDKPRRMHGRRV